MGITDAQVHLWEADRPDRPWPKDVPTRPHRPVPLEAGEMLAAMDEPGVDRAVIVPPSWAGENNATALEAAEKHPRRFAVMGRFNPRLPEARAQLEGWLKQPHMLGIRLTFHQKPWSDWLDDGSLDWFWSAAERLRIPLMIHVPGLAPKVQPIAQGHPGLTLVIDHLARSSQLRGAEAWADLDDLLALARQPNVTVKASAMPCGSTEAYPFADLTQHIRRVYAAFGPRRMLWGSDYSRLTCSYRECLDHVRNSLDFLSAEDKEWILGKALAQTLNWPEPAS